MGSGFVTEASNADFAAFVATTEYVTLTERPLDPPLRSIPALARSCLSREGRASHAELRAKPRDLRGWWEYISGAD